MLPEGIAHTPPLAACLRRTSQSALAGSASPDRVAGDVPTAAGGSQTGRVAVLSPEDGTDEDQRGEGGY